MLLWEVDMMAMWAAGRDLGGWDSGSAGYLHLVFRF